ncbi:phenylacetate--CoA ligase family protein [Euzebya sp.]|uniref:phenylacetate--CoA ligase family protein n=1 Tax=Euzebya sp. TaxID=1971409 RepID=UPI0035173FEF
MVRYFDAELETMPWTDVLAWQAERTATFVRGLVDRSPFHTEKLAGVGVPTGVVRDLAFLEDLPFTTKAEVRESQSTRDPALPLGRHQAVPRGAIHQVLSSSGTTGQPVLYGLTATDVEMWADVIATAFWTAGVRPDDIAGHLVGLPGVAGGLPYADGFRRIGAGLAWIGGWPTERVVELMISLGVDAVLATSSFGTYLTDRCEDLVGIPAKDIGVRKMLGGGEPGLGQPEIRQKIVEGWGLDVLSEIMGLGDVLACLWAECEDGGGMHFCGQRAVAVELVDPATGEPRAWEEGVRGEAVYTTFAREATPALRYRSRDHVLVTATSCACGRTSPRIRCVGRTDDMLIYKGMNVFPSSLRDVVLQGFADDVQPSIRVWKDGSDQVRFDGPIPMDVEASDDLAPDRYREVAAAIAADVRARLQVRVAVTVVAPGSMPRTAYKTPLVHVRETDDDQ